MNDIDTLQVQWSRGLPETGGKVVGPIHRWVGPKTIKMVPSASPLASLRDHGSKVETKFHIFQDVTIIGAFRQIKMQKEI